MATAVKKPSPGTERPSIWKYIGAKKSSILDQKIHRIQAVTKIGRVTKMPAMNRTLNQFFAAERSVMTLR